MNNKCDIMIQLKPIYNSISSNEEYYYKSSIINVLINILIYILYFIIVKNE